MVVEWVEYSAYNTESSLRWLLFCSEYVFKSYLKSFTTAACFNGFHVSLGYRMWTIMEQDKNLSIVAVIGMLIGCLSHRCPMMCVLCIGNLVGIVHWHSMNCLNRDFMLLAVFFVSQFIHVIMTWNSRNCLTRVS